MWAGTVIVSGLAVIVHVLVYAALATPRSVTIELAAPPSVSWRHCHILRATQVEVRFDSPSLASLIWQRCRPLGNASSLASRSGCMLLFSVAQLCCMLGGLRVQCHPPVSPQQELEVAKCGLGLYFHPASASASSGLNRQAFALHRGDDDSTTAKFAHCSLSHHEQMLKPSAVLAPW